MANKRNIGYIVMSDEHYTSLDIQETIRSLRPGYYLLGMAEDSEQSTEMLNNNDIDLIIADLQLSDGDSADAIRHSRQQHTPVIFTTPYRKDNPVYDDLNVFAFMVKPVSSSELAKVIVRFEEKEY